MSCLGMDRRHLVAYRMSFVDGSLVLRWPQSNTARVLLGTRSLWHSSRLGHNCIRKLATSGWRCSSDDFGSGAGEAGAKPRWSARLAAYLRSLRWTPIPLGVGFALIAYQQYRHVLRRERKLASQGATYAQTTAKPWEVSAYRLLPLRLCSRAWGWINGLYLPVWTRQSILGWYVRTFNCDLTEALEPDLRRYSNLGELFRRELRPDARPICPHSQLVSPCDGTVLHVSAVDEGVVEQVKGVTYSLRQFLGPADWNSGTQVSTASERSDGATYQRQLLSSSCATSDAADERTLQQCVIYLAPGDYHRFHSPVDWTPRHRRHFPGDLLSVSPAVAGWIADLFCLNERVVYTGRWRQGFFALAAVGATNVGSIRVYCDEALQTNERRWQPGVHRDRVLAAADGESLSRGAPFGEFNLGSTIVLVFEARRDFRFRIQPGDKVRVGQSLAADAELQRQPSEQTS